MSPSIKSVILTAAAVFWSTERVVGLAGLADDWRTWREILTMIPDPLGWAAFGASLALLLNHLWVVVAKKRKARAAKETVAVSYLGAGAIIDHYISPATIDMKPAILLIVRKDLLDKFSNTTGAKMGEHQYNGVLLRQWLESNAARFLVDHRGEMQ